MTKDNQPAGNSAQRSSTDLPGAPDHRSDHDTLRHLARILLLLLVVIVGIVFIWGYVQVSSEKVQRPWVTDLAKFYSSAKLYLDGNDIYAEIQYTDFGPLPPDVNPTRETFHPNLNPPLQTLLFAPLVRFEFATVYWIWFALSVILGVIATLRLSREIGPVLTRWTERPIQTPVLICALFCSFPTMIGLTLGQFSMILYLLVVSIWIAARRDQDILAGVLCGLAISLKLFTGMYVLLFLFLRKWRLSAVCALSFFAFTVAGSLAIGTDSHLKYLEILRSVTWFGAGWNASLLGFFSPVFGGSENTPWIDWPALSSGLALVLSVAGIALMYRLVNRTRPRLDRSAIDLGFALAGPLMLLASPLGWNYYFPVLLLSVVIGIKYSQGIENGGRWRNLIIAAWLLSITCLTPVASTKMNGPMLWFTYPAFDTYVLLMMAIAVVGLHAALLGRDSGRSARRTASDTPVAG